MAPLRVSYNFTGFFQPVENGIWNKAKAGSAIPVKFSLGGDRGRDIFKTGYPRGIQTACPGGSTPAGLIEPTVMPGGSSLTYDPATGRYIYVWQTNKTWASKCFRFDLGLSDGSSHTFDVSFTK